MCCSCWTSRPRNYDAWSLPSTTSPRYTPQHWKIHTNTQYMNELSLFCHCAKWLEGLYLPYLQREDNLYLTVLDTGLLLIQSIFEVVIYVIYYYLVRCFPAVWSTSVFIVNANLKLPPRLPDVSVNPGRCILPCIVCGEFDGIRC